MISVKITRLSHDGSGSIEFDGPQKELTTLLAKLYTSFLFDPSLKLLLSRENVGNCKEALVEVSNKQ